MSNPGERLFLEITGRFYSENGADIVDSLERYVVRVCVAQSEGATHLTELLRRCFRLPEIDKARVHDRVFQNGEFSGHHMGSLKVGVV